jgi:hypothetical protein
MGGEHRGFAFVEFNSSQEAQLAKESLKNLHLYGKLQYTTPCCMIANILIRTQ